MENKIILSDIAIVTAGQSPKSEFFSNEEGFPFLQGNRTFGFLYPEIDTYTKKITKKANSVDILISVRAPVGDLNIAPCDLCIGRGLASVRAKDNNNSFIL
jgi:type I restriction enzyme S subunit